MSDEELPAIIAEHDETIVSWASALEQDIQRTIGSINHAWVVLAACLYEFHQGRAWQALGYDNLEMWLAGPEIGLGRRQFFSLVEMYRELHIERGINVSEIGRADMTKVATILPAIRRGQIEAMTALADAEVLTRDDLRVKYQEIATTPSGVTVNPSDMTPDDFHYESCPTCGSKVRVKG